MPAACQGYATGVPSHCSSPPPTRTRAASLLALAVESEPPAAPADFFWSSLWIPTVLSQHNRVQALLLRHSVATVRARLPVPSGCAVSRARSVFSPRAFGRLRSSPPVRDRARACCRQVSRVWVTLTDSLTRDCDCMYTRLLVRSCFLQVSTSIVFNAALLVSN